ncbi:hypothetical protein ASF69_01605 [Rhizobium sp. Leaf311]|uniref:phosphorylase family protein n=1 Tax=Rhizobium sp. Leaf311 TaxID=1736332 RepID=UPI000714B732|nr:hypothetical protein [Rhizobium sp. Leaf311]KQQ61145.1 hypothetical protein ASF69_01605 [Rhizobium sp. Leaf311]
MVAVQGIDEDGVAALPLLKSFITMFSADFDLQFLDAPKKNASLYAACVLTPRKEIQLMFGLTQPILSIFFVEDHLKLPLAEIVAREYLNVKKVCADPDPRYIFVCSTGEKASLASDFLSMFSEDFFIFVPFVISAKFKLDQIKHSIFRNIGIKDYFENSDPIRSDNMFFGRQRLLTSALGAARDGQNIGIFGLRRVGKTSILFSIQRAFDQRKLGKFVIFSLDDPSRVQASWYLILSQLADIIHPNSIKERFDERNAATIFKGVIRKYLEGNPGKGIVIAFDEIEHIVPGTAKARYWEEGYFSLMDVLRAISRDLPKFSIMICGINAKAVEQSHFFGMPNPIFNGMSVIDVPMFSLDETSHMVTRLGWHMGIQFRPEAIELIQREYGGHPLLVRQFCSKMFAKMQEHGESWPFTAGRHEVAAQMDVLRPQLHYWANYIFYTLKDFYPDEYDMLRVLAQGDATFYASMEESSPEFATHLRGYGLVIGKPPKLSMPFLARYLSSPENGVIDDIALASAEAFTTPTDAARAYDYLVIAALDEEFSAFVKALNRNKLVELKLENDMPYTLYEVILAGGTSKTKKRVLVCTPDRSGPFTMQNLVLHLHFKFDIKHYILIGICAGLRSKTDIGDLVIADQIIDYSQGKLTNDGMEARPLVFPAGAWLHNAAKRFKRFKWPSGFLPKEVGTIRVGNVASGPLVFADNNSLKRIATSWPKLIGAEMEAAGVLHALHSIGQGDRLLVVKAVSDFGDASKNDSARNKCCAASAAFALQFIRSTELSEVVHG